jgi:hypothetical protein
MTVKQLYVERGKLQDDVRKALNPLIRGFYERTGIAVVFIHVTAKFDGHWLPEIGIVETVLDDD